MIPFRGLSHVSSTALCGVVFLLTLDSSFFVTKGDFRAMPLRILCHVLYYCGTERNMGILTGCVMEFERQGGGCHVEVWKNDNGLENHVREGSLGVTGLFDVKWVIGSLKALVWGNPRC